MDQLHQHLGDFGERQNVVDVDGDDGVLRHARIIGFRGFLDQRHPAPFLDDREAGRAVVTTSEPLGGHADARIRDLEHGIGTRREAEAVPLAQGGLCRPDRQHPPSDMASRAFPARLSSTCSSWPRSA